MVFPADAQAQLSLAMDQGEFLLCEGAVEENSGRRESSDEEDLRSDEGSPQSKSAISYAISATNVTSIFQQGPGVSAGSAQHPNGCEPCVYYCFSKRGCNQGEACTQCHGFHESKLRKKRAQWKKNVRSSYRERVFKKNCEEASPLKAENPLLLGDLLAGKMGAYIAYDKEDAEQTDFAPQLPAMGAPFVYPTQMTPPLAPTWPYLDAAALKTPSYVGSGPTAVDPMKMMSSPAAQIFAYSQSRVVATVGQEIELLPQLDKRLIFAVAPDLPEGLELDIYSGWIRGSATEAQGPATYFVTACEPGALIDVTSIRIAVVDISIVDMPPLPVPPLISNLTSWGLACHERSFLPAASMERVIASHLQEQLLQTVLALRCAEKPSQIINSRGGEHA
jgi:hypothetical protein